MKTLKLMFSILLPASLFAQAPCDQLDLVSIQWDAFETGQITLVVQNSSNDIFSYPNFTLLNGTEEVAIEQTTSFGLGAVSTHTLQAGPLPIANTFNGTVNLHTMFDSEVTCSWDLPVSLCPTACHELELVVTNTSAFPQSIQHDWSILDSNGDQVAEGSIQLSDDVQEETIPLCLIPDQYRLQISAPLANETTVNYELRTAESFASPGIFFAPGVEPTIMDFTFFEECTAQTTSVQGPERANIHIWSENGLIMVSTPGKPIGTVEIFNIAGHLLMSTKSTQDRSSFNLIAQAAGVHLVRITRPTGEISVRKVFTQ